MKKKSDSAPSKPFHKTPAVIVFGVFLLWLLGGLFRPVKPVAGLEIQEFGSLPVLLNGRIQPLQSVGRNSLLMIRGKSSVRYEENGEKKKLEAAPWLLEVVFKPEVANTRPLFLIHHPEVKSELGLDGLKDAKGKERKYFSYDEITSETIDRFDPMTGLTNSHPKNFTVLSEQAQRIENVEDKLRTPLDKQFWSLHSSIGLYLSLKASLRPPNSADFLRELNRFSEAIPVGLEVARSGNFNDLTPEQRQTVQFLGRAMRDYEQLDRMAHILAMPPTGAEGTSGEWTKIGKALKESMRAGEVHPAAMAYAKMGQACRAGDSATFNQEVQNYRNWLTGKGMVEEQEKGRTEFAFNTYEPFYKSMVVYVTALLLGVFYWLNFKPWVRQAGFWLLMLALVVHSAGLIIRMVLEDRPPVTNLYSSAVFVGWGAVILCAILERIFKDGIGIVVASVVGFSTLIIAHHLSLSGDTMQMMQAVLDTNFWLATHVVVITIGYSSMFVAGFLAIVYILRGFFTTGLDKDTAMALKRMVYGILCFATLFSFVGTILGGIWADQSWGRFWGWDPKENGALLIVLWCAIVLHARWGGMIKERGLMGMAVFGNIVTAFSWFGVNMLGVGLHSYGFMDKAMFWLMAFIASQAVLIGICALPPRMWKSFEGGKGGNAPQAPLPKSGAPATA